MEPRFSATLPPNGLGVKIMIVPEKTLPKGKTKRATKDSSAEKILARSGNYRLVRELPPFVKNSREELESLTDWKPIPNATLND